jgi:hypothetical protein
VARLVDFIEDSKRGIVLGLEETDAASQDAEREERVW